jgi:hypothetical protein
LIKAMRRGKAKKFNAEGAEVGAQRSRRKPNGTAAAARFDAAEQGAGGAGKADPSGKKRLRDDNLLLVARFETVRYRCQGKSTSKTRA